MEGNENQNSSTNNSENPVDNTNSLVDNIGESGSEKIRRKPIKTTTHKENGKTIVINIFNDESESTEAATTNSIATEANNISQKSNNISWVGIMINGLLLIFTGTLAYIAISQSKSAIKAAEIADSTSKQSKKYNDSSLAIQRRVFDNNNAEDVRREKREMASAESQERSINAQINSIKVTQREFNIGNEPYLQITDSKCDTFEVGKKINITFSIRNLGSYPVKIISCKFFITTRVTDPRNIKNESKIINNEGLINMYAIKESSLNYVIHETRLLNNARFNGVKNGNLYVWFNGSIKYKNIITKDPKIYDFSIKIKPNDFSAFEYNENKTEKKN